ncbi:hypothetical protein HKX48_006096 [Thoreauomyces humboldtii]|nr:hypothetical protein HKX48_006096 [Thoreauomyces humboldtii]
MPSSSEHDSLLGGGGTDVAYRTIRSERKGCRAVLWLALVLVCIGGVSALIFGRHTPLTQDPTRINWSTCPDDVSFQCGTYTVPLNHADPDGITISIALIKYPAQTTDKLALGSLFTNPGGPGGSSVKHGGKRLSKQLDGRYSIIGFDPRGVGASNPIRCFDSATIHRAFDGRALPANISAPGAFEFEIAHEMARAQLCRKNAGYLLPYLSTAAVARDMDLLRHAENEEQLHFWGFSYGSLLGQTYINMFPERVGRIAIDGVVNPIAWSEGWGLSAKPSTRDVQWLSHAEEVYEEFSRACEQAGFDRCALATADPPQKPYVAQRIQAFLDLVALNPLSVPFAAVPGVVTITTVRQLLTDMVYQPKTWPDYAQALAEAMLKGNGTLIQNLVVRATADDCPAADIPLDEAFWAISCGDAGPSRFDGAALKAEVIAANNDYFIGGTMCTNYLLGCSQWPGIAAERYSGPWNATTVSTVLVIGNAHDPATTIESARIAHSLLPNSRLMEIDSWGHCSHSQPSRCADEVVRDFFVMGHPPSASVTHCNPDDPPFPAAHDVYVAASEERNGKSVNDALNDVWRRSRVRKAGTVPF